MKSFRLAGRALTALLAALLLMLAPACSSDDNNDGNPEGGNGGNGGNPSTTLTVSPEKLTLGAATGASASVTVTTDHGAANNILMLQEHGIPAGGFVYKKVAEELDKYLAGKFNAGRKLVTGISDYKVFLDHDAIDALSLSLADVKAAAIEWLRRDSRYAYIIDLEHAATATLPAVIKEKIIKCTMFY